jgi:hypothetical protein
VYALPSYNDLIGSTINDLNLRMSGRWGCNAEQVAGIDEKVLKTKEPYVDNNRVWLNYNGFVWHHRMNKIPVLGANKQVSAILSLCEDSTAHLTLNKLYYYYCNFYQNKYLRVEKFLQHIGVYTLFFSLPTHSEVKVLIAKKILVHNKLIAHSLNISLGTIETHINKLCQKTNSLLIVLATMNNIGYINEFNPQVKNLVHGSK